ncbi:MAG: methyltransferase [Alphaproteobacteria bacterium RIFCSPLOWO2_01_FULL_40_26]|nr:MAG: methyltransferase [Alphaproteobacteria bacterium RIFCSPHIGHO2_02_FULL_40_34]OFW94186.1 MAG: methyltransferase [Alphaproteobacteria bacterium RIFCSPLOWO2_01_FULL_40_26]OFX09755.1 MAG: methyltransferase [Alphaproteobacteria bacterium RIFCSPLOWO2_02_FULL_40_19]OFX11463.1 MAG: methyltransferase [Alphaproteobacteria bacterium RIFCSPLOWO2_12_FULL_40_11]
MKTNWDYTALADAYIKRPDYSVDALNRMFQKMSLKPDATICDIGAGVGHLTIELAKKSFEVIAVEPNDAMRANGINRTMQFKNVSWGVGTGEETNQESKKFDAITFGSSFNVCDQNKALAESKRLTNDRGWFVCMWNYRDVNDSIQKKIEDIIKNNISGYSYGNRREDQMEFLKNSGMFSSVDFIEGNVVHKQSLKDCVEAWRSHGTLHRQAGDEKFTKIISEIEKFLTQNNIQTLSIPYTTRMWVAKFK